MGACALTVFLPTARGLAEKMLLIFFYFIRRLYNLSRRDEKGEGEGEELKKGKGGRKEGVKEEGEELERCKGGRRRSGKGKRGWRKGRKKERGKDERWEG